MGEIWTQGPRFDVTLTRDRLKVDVPTPPPHAPGPHVSWSDLVRATPAADGALHVAPEQTDVGQLAIRARQELVDHPAVAVPVSDTAEKSDDGHDVLASAKDGEARPRRRWDMPPSCPLRK